MAASHLARCATRSTPLLQLRPKRTERPMGIISNTRSVSGRLAPWVERLAERGLVAVLACNTPAYLAVEGSAEPCLGTNPIAWACPRRDGPPVVVDLALAASSSAAIEVAAAAGAKLPRGVAIDADGKPTRDAAAALDGGAQLPAGGIKGALLALLVEVLSGGLAGGDLAVDSDDYHTMDRSLFLLVVDPAMTTREFDVERLLEKLEDARAARAGAAARESREASRRAGRGPRRPRVGGVVVRAAKGVRVFGPPTFHAAPVGLSVSSIAAVIQGGDDQARP